MWKALAQCESVTHGLCKTSLSASRTLLCGKALRQFSGVFYLKSCLSQVFPKLRIGLAHYLGVVDGYVGQP